MNIMYLCDEYPPGRYGGIGISVQSLAKEMVKNGHNVIVAGCYHWGYGEEDEFNDEGVKVYRFRRILAGKFFSDYNSIRVRTVNKIFKHTGIFQWDIVRSLKKYHAFLENLIRLHEIDIVEMPDFHDYVSFCRKPIFFPKLSAPCILKIHGSATFILKENNKPVPEIMWQIEREFLMQADFVCSVSKYVADKTNQYFQCDIPVKVLYNGIDVPQKIQAKKIPGRVIFVGSLNHNKGVSQLLKAWNIVSKKNSGAELVIIGKGNPAPLTRLLGNDAKGRVHFCGQLSRGEVLLKMAEAEVAIFPSYTESFGMVVFEAMVCNTAVIYTKRAVGPEFINDHHNGVLIDPDNVSEIAEAILELLRDKKKLDQIARNGNNFVKEIFNIHSIARQYYDYYEEVLKAKTSEKFAVELNTF